MVSEKQGEGIKLDAELTRLGLPGERHGDTRDRAELMQVNPATLRSWLSDRRPIPKIVWAWLKLYSLLTAEDREQFRIWARERSKTNS